MKEITIKIKYDDRDGYMGHGDDVNELIIGGLKNVMRIDLEHDGVIKEGWNIDIIPNSTVELDSKLSESSIQSLFSKQDKLICELYHLRNPKNPSNPD